MCLLDTSQISFIRFYKYQTTNYFQIIFISGPLRKFFSLRVFVPWSRLSFALIMGQFSYLTYSMGTSRAGKKSFANLMIKVRLLNQIPHYWKEFIPYILTPTAFTYAPLAMVKELITSHVFIFILGNFISLVIEQPALNLLESYTGFKKRQKLSPRKSLVK